MLAVLRRKLDHFVSDERFSEILAGSAWSFSSKILATGIGLLTSVLVARIYGADMVGILAIIQAFLTIATIVTMLGMNTSILRLIPEHVVKYSVTSAFNVYRKIQYFVVSASILVGILLYATSELIATKLFSKPYLSSYFALAAAFVVFRSLADLNTHAVRGVGLIKAFAIMQVFPPATFLLVLIGFTLIHGDQDSPVYAQLASWAATAVVGVAIMEFYFKSQIRPGDSASSMPLWEILRISSPMMMTASMQFVIGQTGVLFIGVYGNESDVGYYAIAVKMATLSSFVLYAINSMAAPKFSALYHKGALDELFYVARKSTRLIFWTTVPVLIVLLVAGGPLLDILFGAEFRSAYPAMVILLVGQFANSIAGSTGVFMNMTGHQLVFRNVMVTAGLINIALSVLLIPRFGITGAAIAGTVCIASWNIFTLAYIKRRYGESIAYIPLLSNHIS